MSYWVINFGMVCMFLLHLLVVLLFLLAVLLVHVLQAFPPFMLLHHLIPLELIMAVFVKVLQVFSRLKKKTKCCEREFTHDLQKLYLSTPSELIHSSLSLMFLECLMAADQVLKHLSTKLLSSSNGLVEVELITTSFWPVMLDYWSFL